MVPVLLLVCQCVLQSQFKPGFLVAAGGGLDGFRHCRVSDDQQARYAVEAYQRAQADWPWVGVINYWFFKRPTDMEKDQPAYYFRLLEPDFEETQAWQHLFSYTSERFSTEIGERAGWTFTWDRLRPLLALSGGAILFFLILGYLAPEEEKVSKSKEQ